MDKSEDAEELERKIAEASRLAFRVGDQSTISRLLAWTDELKKKLQRHSDAGRIQDDIRRRAQELWELEGRPSGRDLEFWFRAEDESRAP